MDQGIYTKATAEAVNRSFEEEVNFYLSNLIADQEDNVLLRFGQPLEVYLANDALRDFFLNTQHPFQELLKNSLIGSHLSRGVYCVYFDPVSGDPLLSVTEQRIYNLARRMDREHMHVPFRSIQPNKQNEAGDNSDINTYPAGSEEIRYNSGNHFSSRPANENVFDENSKRCIAKSAGNLHVFFKRGFLEDRLQEAKELTAALHKAGSRQLQFFVICSRHSLKEGHFGTSLLIMDPANPDFPTRVMICDTLLKELPHHPRWWHYFVAEYSNVFGDAISEIIEDLSHPLQKVNIKGDAPYRHDWDCPYYVTSMTNALSDLVTRNPESLLNGSLQDIHYAMREMMPDYYNPDGEIKSRQDLRYVNRLKRWESGRQVINNLMIDIDHLSSYEF